MNLPSLLPCNATPMELTLEKVLRDALSPLNLGVNDILTCKENPKDDWLLWLVWEYGLEELLPYIPDLRQLIAEGIPWQRIRGTPASVKQALGWVGAPDASFVEEEETGGVHWQEFMIDSGYVPNGPIGAERIVEVSKIAAPVGTVLSRIYHGYDVRRFILDKSDWGDLLSDYSGYKDNVLGVVLSFGRYSPMSGRFEDGLGEAIFSHLRGHFGSIRYEDRPLLDFSMVFGEVPQPVHESTIYQYVTAFGGTLANDAWHDQLWPDVPWYDFGTPVYGGQLPVEQKASICRVLPRAAVVLSDSDPLGDTNAVLMFRELAEIGGPIYLSSGDKPSDKPWSFKYLPIDERFERLTGSAATYDASGLVSFSDNCRQHDTGLRYEDRVLLDYSPVFGELPVPVHESSVYRSSTVFGGSLLNDPWHDEVWPDVPWLDFGTRYFAGQLPVEQTPSVIRILPRAAIILSDSDAMGDTNAVLMASELVETGGPIYLSSGDMPSDKTWALNYLPVDERFERVTGAAIEYDSAIARADAVHICLHAQQANGESEVSGALVMEVESVSFTQPFIQSWQPVTWGADNWRETEIIVRTQHYGDTA